MKLKLLPAWLLFFLWSSLAFGHVYYYYFPDLESLQVRIETTGNTWIFHSLDINHPIQITLLSSYSWPNGSSPAEQVTLSQNMIDQIYNGQAVNLSAGTLPGSAYQMQLQPFYLAYIPQMLALPVQPIVNLAQVSVMVNKLVITSSNKGF